MMRKHIIIYMVLGPLIGALVIMLAMSMLYHGAFSMFLKKETIYMVLLVAYAVGAIPAGIAGAYIGHSKSGKKKNSKKRLSNIYYYSISAIATYLMIIGIGAYECWGLSNIFMHPPSACKYQNIFALLPGTPLVVLVGVGVAGLMRMITSSNKKIPAE